MNAYERQCTELESSLSGGPKPRLGGADFTDEGPVEGSNADVSALLSDQLEASLEANQKLSWDLEAVQKK